MQTTEIEKLIKTQINCEFIQVSSNDNTHYEALIVSTDFTDKTKIQRHRMVYSSLGDHMVSDIHALSMKLYTPQEHKSINE